MGNNELGVLDALFRFKVKDSHSAKVHWAVMDGSGCGAVDAHLGEGGGEVGGLDLLALLPGETGCAQWIL